MSVSASRQAAALSLVLAASASVHADPVPDTVVVTANRTPQRADDVIPDTVVVTSEDIARAGANSVADVLRRQRGIEIARNGGAGTSTSVFLRGANSNQVVVLVDGVRIGSATTGAAAWNAIPLSSIDHIEIVYGPLSALYGADAIGGVVQIFTKKSDGHPVFSAGAGGGTYGTNQYDASVHGATGGEHSVTYALSGAREESDGFSATRPGAFGYNPDDDGYTRNSVNGRVALRLAEGHEIGAQFLQSRLNAQYDNGSSAFDAHNIQEVDSYAVFLNDRFRPNWRSSVQVARSEDKSGSFTSTGPTGTSQLNTRQDEFTWQNTFDLNGDTLQVLKEELDPAVGGVMHCFSGSLELARECIKLGMAISFAGPVTFKNAHNLQDVAKNLPLESLLIETDSPYLAPTPYRGKRNEPAFVAEVAKKLAELHGITVEELAAHTTANTRKLFRIPA